MADNVSQFLTTLQGLSGGLGGFSMPGSTTGMAGALTPPAPAPLTRSFDLGPSTIGMNPNEMPKPLLDPNDKIREIVDRQKMEKQNREESNTLSNYVNAFKSMSEWEPKLKAQRDEVESLVQQYAGIANPELQKPEFSDWDIIGMAAASLMGGRVQPQMVRGAYENAVAEAQRKYQNETVAAQGEKEALGMQINLSQSALADMQRLAQQDQDLGLKLFMYQGEMARQGRMDEFLMQQATVKALFDQRQTFNDADEITPEVANQYNLQIDQAMKSGVPAFLLPVKIVAGPTALGKKMAQDNTHWNKEFKLKETAVGQDVKASNAQIALNDKKFVQDAWEGRQRASAQNKSVALDGIRVDIAKREIDLKEALSSGDGTLKKKVRTNAVSDMDKINASIKGAKAEIKSMLDRARSFEGRAKTQDDSDPDYKEANRLRHEADLKRDELSGKFAVASDAYDRWSAAGGNSDSATIADIEAYLTDSIKSGKMKASVLDDALKAMRIQGELKEYLKESILSKSFGSGPISVATGAASAVAGG